MSENALPVAEVKRTPGATAKAFEPSFALALWIFAVLGCGLLAAGLGNWASGVYTVATLGLFMLPGFFIVQTFIPDKSSARIERVIVGAVLGLGISGYVALVVGFRCGWSPVLIGSAILALSAFCALAGRIFKGRVDLAPRKWTPLDHSILAAMCLVVVAFTSLPALHVGKLTTRGYAYTWLYGMDLLSRSDFSIAMTARMPPDFFWMTGTPLRMYLLGYTVPAFAFAASGKTISMHSVMLLTTLCLSVLFVGCLFVFLRSLFADAKALAGAAFVTLVGYSYYWVYDVAKAPFIRPGHRFEYHDSVSHLFQRSFLVEPQALLATSLLLVMLAMMALAHFRLRSYTLGIFMGICLGVSFGAEAVQGMMMVGWLGLFFIGKFLLVKGSLKEELRPFLAAVVACGAICCSYLFLGMYQGSTSRMMTIEFNTWIVKYGLAYFPIEFGPLLILGVWGAIRWWRGAREDFGWPLLLLGFVALIPVLLIKTPVPQETRMVDRLWPVMLAAFSAYLVRELWSSRGKGKSRLLAATLVLAAVPTFFTDIYYTSNVNDLYNTRYVLPEDMQACDWIRQNLPSSAVVQGAYNYFILPDRGLYFSLISSFAQRPQVLGWFSGAATLVDDGWPIARQRRAEIEAAMGSGNLDAVLGFLSKYSVEYVYVGPVEQRQFKPLLPLLEGAPGEFQQVYSQDGVFIFRCLRKTQPVHTAAPLS